MRETVPSGRSPGIIIFVFFTVIILFFSLKVGTLGGDLVYEMNNGLIENIDTQNFKDLLSFELPLIDIVYNSGKVSLQGEIQKFIETLFGFETRMPSSIVSAETAFFKEYYVSRYLPKMEMMGVNDGGENEKPGEKVEEPDSRPDDIMQEPGEKPYKEEVSSIRFEEDETKFIERSQAVEEGIITLFNETDYAIDEKMIQDLLGRHYSMDFDRRGPSVLIYHTHTTEAYLKSIDELDKEVSARTMDERYSVVRVGDELARILENRYDIGVIHNGTIHDYPNFNSSYLNAAETLNKYLESYPSIKLAIDIHRDAVDSDSKLRVVKDVDGKNVARVMFVVGTDAIGLEHAHWKKNLQLAIKMQQKLNEYCPGLAKHIYISGNRYNQHMAEGSLLIEVGGDGNLVEECLESCKYLAAALNDLIHGR